MSQPVPSFQDVVHPLQELAKFKTKLQTCQHMLSDLQKSIPAFLPDADIQISVANQSLHHIDQNLEIEYQLMRITRVQFQYAVDNAGHLPHLEAD